MSKPPVWAVERANELAINAGMPVERARVFDGPYTAPLQTAFARYIAEHEEPPVDPLLIEARQVAVETLALHANHSPITAREIREGNWDKQPIVQAPLAALRRGIEIGKSKAGQ